MHHTLALYCEAQGLSIRVKDAETLYNVITQALYAARKELSCQEFSLSVRLECSLAFRKGFPLKPTMNGV
jgi:hypothetical protein